MAGLKKVTKGNHLPAKGDDRFPVYSQQFNELVDDLNGDGTARDITLNDLTVNGDATIKGTLTIGDDATADVVTMVAVVDADITFQKEEAHEILIDASTTAATAGGALTVSGGDGSTSGNGGATTVAGGAGGATGTGGNLNLVSGAGGATSGNSGNVNIKSANETGTDSSGTVGVASGTTASANSGNVTFGSGAVSTSGNSGTVAVGSGASAVAGDSGVTSLISGAATTGDTGAVTVASGAVATLGASGVVAIATGASATSGNTGAITIATGAATSGDSGNITLSTGTASVTKGKIILSDIATFNDGSAASPGIQTSTTGHGLYEVSTTQMGISVAGGLVATADTSGLTADSVRNRVSLGTAGTNCTVVEYGDGRDITAVITVTAAVLGAPTAGGASAHGAAVYTFPAGAHVHMATYMSIGLTVGGVTTDTPDVGIGSVVGSGANATLNLVGATSEDYITGQTAADAAGTATVKTSVATAGALTGISINEAGHVKAVYLNAADTWDAGVTGNLTATGTITLKYTIMS